MKEVKVNKPIQYFIMPVLIALIIPVMAVMEGATEGLGAVALYSFLVFSFMFWAFGCYRAWGDKKLLPSFKMLQESYWTPGRATQCLCQLCGSTVTGCRWSSLNTKKKSIILCHIPHSLNLLKKDLRLRFT